MARRSKSVSITRESWLWCKLNSVLEFVSRILISMYLKCTFEISRNNQRLNICSKPSRRHFQPWDNFHRKKFAAQTFSAARHFQPWGWKTLSALRHFQLQQFQPWDTCGSEKLSAGRHFQPWDTCGFEKLSAGRNFQSGETFSPENSWETLSAPRQFRPRNTFSLKKLSASKHFQPRETLNLFF